MKQLLIMLTLILTAELSTAQANGYVATVECDLLNIPNIDVEVERVEIVSVKQFTSQPTPVMEGLTLSYKSGNQETLKPSAKSDVFGNPTYTKNIPFKKGKVFFQGSQIGDIYIAMQCYLAPNIPWDRCQSQGTGEHGEFSGVKMNLGGKVVRFTLCSRSVQSY